MVTGGSCTAGGTRARSIAFGYDDGLLETVTTSEGTTWASNLTYHPNLVVATVQHGAAGSGMLETTTIADHAMARPASITIASGEDTWQSGTFSYDGAGNVKRMGSDHFQYDKVSRLDYATLGSLGRTRDYGFDRYGNLTSVETDEVTTDSFPVDGTTNRLNTPATYDAGGNLTAGNADAYGFDRFDIERESFASRGRSWWTR